MNKMADHQRKAGPRLHVMYKVIWPVNWMDWKMRAGSHSTPKGPRGCASQVWTAPFSVQSRGFRGVLGWEPPKRPLQSWEFTWCGRGYWRISALHSICSLAGGGEVGRHREVVALSSWAMLRALPGQTWRRPLPLWCLSFHSLLP